jgi:hypothetical protein
MFYNTRYQACTIKLFMTANVAISLKARVFSTANGYHSILIFAARLEPSRVEYLTELYSNGKLIALPGNIRLLWESLEMANTLAYYNTPKIMVVESFSQHFIFFVTYELVQIEWK